MKILDTAEVAEKKEEQWKEEKQQIEEYGAKLVGVGDEKRYNRKAVIVEINGKWHHFYGESYHSSFKKAFKKLKKRK